MKYILDTNTCIRYLNGRSESIRGRIERIHPESIAVCSVVKAELFYGAMKSKHPERNLQKQRFFLDQFISFTFDDDAAKT